MSEPSPLNLFEAFSQWAEAIHPIHIAAPGDIIAAEESQDGSIRYELRPGAKTTEIKIRPLTPDEIEEADKLLSLAGSPPPINKRNSDGSSLTVGYDEQNPEYVAKLEPLLRKRQVFYALSGCPQLGKDVPGDSMEDKIKLAMKKLPAPLLAYIAAAVHKFEFTAGDLADFFTREQSEKTAS